MNRPARLRNLTPREVMLFALVAFAATAFVALRWIVVPTFRDWRETQSRFLSLSREHARLLRNLAYKQSAEEQSRLLPPQAILVESEQLTLATWLRDLEVAARRTGVTLNSTKPMPVLQEGGYKVFGVRVSLSGRLPDVLKFVSEVVSGPSVVGIQSYTMRAVRAPNNVECTLYLRMVRIQQPGADGRRRETGDKGVARAG
jgi:hypothetical protein